MQSQDKSAGSALDLLEQSPIKVDEVLRNVMTDLVNDQKVQADALHLERQRLSAKYGPDSRQVKHAALREELHAETRLGIRLQCERLNFKGLEPSGDYFLVFGRVLNSAGDGRPKLSVAAIDEKAKSLVDSKTDDQGFFELRVPIRLVSGTIEVPGKGAESDDQANSRLQVMDGGKTVYRDEIPFQAVAGGQLYREIMLDEKGTCKG